MGIGIGCGVGWGPGFVPEVIGYVGAGCGVGFNVGITLAGFGIGLPTNSLFEAPYNALMATRNGALVLARLSGLSLQKMLQEMAGVIFHPSSLVYKMNSLEDSRTSSKNNSQIKRSTRLTGRA